MALTPGEILDATQTVNETVLDQGIRHAHHLQRLTTHEVNEIVGFLNRDVLPDTLKNLRNRLENISQRGFDTGPWTTNRVRNMLGSTNEIMQKGMQEAGGMLRKDLRQFARTEAEWQVRSLEKATGALDIAFSTPSVSQLNSILTSRPYQGQVFSKWWKNVSRSSQNIINRQIGIGLAQGETVDQMIRRLKGTLGARFRDGALEKVRHNVAATVRTATNHVNTHAREMTFKENDEVIKEIQILATLDGRTTPECRALDGKTFPVDEGPRPPFHYQCRTTTVPVLKSLEELGLPALRRALPPGTRATKELTGHLNKAMNGQVPARVTYGGWLKKQTKGVQNDILGPSRAKMFRAGQVTIDRFVDPRGRPLTLDQLRKREGLIPLEKIPKVTPAPKFLPIEEVPKYPERLEALYAGRAEALAPVVEWKPPKGYKPLQESVAVNKTRSELRSIARAAGVPKYKEMTFFELAEVLSHPERAGKILWKVPPSTVSKVTVVRKPVRVVPPKTRVSYKKTYRKWTSSLTQQDIDIIARWEEDMPMLEDMRLMQSGKKPIWFKEEQVRDFENRFRKVVGRAPHYRGAIHRGMRFDTVDELERFAKAPEFTHKTFAAASKNPQVAKTFSEAWLNEETMSLEDWRGPRAVVHFDVRTGIDIHGGTSITTQGSGPASMWEQSEVILREGTRYRITSARRLGGVPYAEYEIFAQEL